MKPEENEYTHRYLWTDSIWEDFNGVENTTGCLRGISPRKRKLCGELLLHPARPELRLCQPRPGEALAEVLRFSRSPATLNAMIQVMDFWLKMGCDGFRVDMAGSLVKNDPDQEATIRLWQKVRAFRMKLPRRRLDFRMGQPRPGAAGGASTWTFCLHFGPSRYWELFRSNAPYFSRKARERSADF